MSTATLVAIIVLGLASYRITRFFLFDSILDYPRNKWYDLVSGRGAVGNFFYELTSCSWCLGTWVTLALVGLCYDVYPWDFNENTFFVFAATAAIQGFAHALEPEG